MKKTLILLAALALTASAAFAQKPATTTGSDANQNALHQELTIKAEPTPEKQAAQHAAKMAKNLALNPDQQARVEKLWLTHEQETAAIKTKFAADKKAGRPAMKAAHDKYATQLKEILTAEQYAKHQLRKEQHHSKAKEKIKK